RLLVPGGLLCYLPAAATRISQRSRVSQPRCASPTKIEDQAAGVVGSILTLPPHRLQPLDQSMLYRLPISLIEVAAPQIDIVLLP
ncbi:MAG TPA: hypothetical protein VH593_32070, partial [Ktedonobacteraceae bacterium]